MRGFAPDSLRANLARAREELGEDELTIHEASRGAGVRPRSATSWRCDGCGRGIADGAKPGGGDQTPHVGITANLCQRCAGRKRRGMPYDAPASIGRGPAPRSASRAYWESVVWNAAMEAVEHPTDEKHDQSFQQIRSRFFAAVALASSYLVASDYIRPEDVPLRIGCNGSVAREE